MFSGEAGNRGVRVFRRFHRGKVCPCVRVNMSGKARNEGGVARREAKDRQPGENRDLDLSDRSSRPNVTYEELTSCPRDGRTVPSTDETKLPSGNKRLFDFFLFFLLVVVGMIYFRDRLLGVISSFVLSRTSYWLG